MKVGKKKHPKYTCGLLWIIIHVMCELICISSPHLSAAALERLSEMHKLQGLVGFGLVLLSLLLKLDGFKEAERWHEAWAGLGMVVCVVTLPWGQDSACVAASWWSCTKPMSGWWYRYKHWCNAVLGCFLIAPISTCLSRLNSHVTAMPSLLKGEKNNPSYVLLIVSALCRYFECCCCSHHCSGLQTKLHHPKCLPCFWSTGYYGNWCCSSCCTGCASSVPSLGFF